MTEYKEIKKPDVSVAAILDPMVTDWLKFECRIILLGINDWKERMQQENINLLLVQSAWAGNNGQWQNEIADLETTHNTALKELIYWCNENKIPTVFWNIEDPYHFDRFLQAAVLFDYVFTTDINSIEKYVKFTSHDKVYVLPFAAQPKINNPIDKDKERRGRIAFAGTWYKIGHDDRKRDMENVLKPALKYGVHIYDRMYHYTKSNYYKFPSIYQPNIVGSLSYEEVLRAYKQYDIFLNMNTVQNSPTMFANRVFELLACGTNLVSGYALGIEKMFPKVVKLCKNKKDTEKYLDILLANKEIRDRLSLLGQRKVFSHHTYTHRLNTILEKTGTIYKSEVQSGISIITCTNRLEYLKNILENFNRQNYPNKELIIVLNNKKIDINLWQSHLNSVTNIRLFQVDEKNTIGEGLNFAIDCSRFEYITIFDDANYYGAEFTGDLMRCFKYTKAQIVGKYSHFCYFEDSKALVVRFPNMENQYVDYLYESSMIIQKKVFENVRFLSETNNIMHRFLEDCIKRGIKLYAADRFNFACKISTAVLKHDKKQQEDELLSQCETVLYTTDYKTHIII